MDNSTKLPKEQQAGHSTTAVTRKHYAVNETSRENEFLRSMNNQFAPEQMN